MRPNPFLGTRIAVFTAHPDDEGIAGATVFARSVYAIVAAIPKGYALTYGEVARRGARCARDRAPMAAPRRAAR